VSGKVKITLKHLPGIKTGGNNFSIGETDIEVEFPVLIE
jgi:hypothetical protein